MKVNLKTLSALAIWLTMAGGLFYFFSAQLYPNTAEKISSGHEVTLARDLSGHYRAEAFINGVKTSILVDTGATDVSISQELANKLGITNWACRAMLPSAPKPPTARLSPI